jgi:hypothetical protein
VPWSSVARDAHLVHRVQIRSALSIRPCALEHVYYKMRACQVRRYSTWPVHLESDAYASVGRGCATPTQQAAAGQAAAGRIAAKQATVVASQLKAAAHQAALTRAREGGVKLEAAELYFSVAGARPLPRSHSNYDFCAFPSITVYDNDN